MLKTVHSSGVLVSLVQTLGDDFVKALDTSGAEHVMDSFLGLPSHSASIVCRSLAKASSASRKNSLREQLDTQ